MRNKLGLILTLAAAMPLAACSVDEAAETGGYDTGFASEGGEGDSAGLSTGAEGGDPGGGTSGGDGGPAGEEGGAEEGETEGPDTQPGQLTAGEWSDLDHWDFWLGLADSEWLEFLTEWGIDTSVRVPVRVVSGDVPVVDVAVSLSDANQSVLWEARTDAHGDVELWPGLFSSAIEWPLTIRVGNESAVLDEPPSAEDPIVIQAAGGAVDPALDLMFVVDTTGSMSDELEYLKAELGNVIERVEDELGGDVDLRLSVNFYRDEGDAYVVRSFPFTVDVDEALGQIAAQSADGGGDYPEAVHAALADAVDNHEWRGSARSRLLFFALYAPPHDTQDVHSSIAESVRSLAEEGVRVIPLGASGIDKHTEFLMRNIDIATGGTYTFLTDDSGIGNSHLEPSVGDYEVELLNDLMVRLIVDSMG